RAVASVDLLRPQLEPERNLLGNSCGGREFITINGKDRHGISYLSDFLFSPDRIRTPVKALSGGEQNRAILAKLFSKPANVLVLDEPTNDLDIETLELLEEILVNFDGTLLLVSHDRAFMDNVVTSILVFEGEGRVEDYVGGYSDWIARGGKLLAIGDTREAKKPAAPVVSEAAATTPAKSPPDARKKLSYKDQRELDALPAKIESLESRLGEFEQTMASAEFYQQPQGAIDNVLNDLASCQAELEQCYQRWTELEG